MLGRQMVSHAWMVLAVAIVNAALSSPGACRATTAGLSVRGKTTRLANKAERGEPGEPVKPL
jgi:hypothetical protein